MTRKIPFRLPTTLLLPGLLGLLLVSCDQKPAPKAEGEAGDQKAKKKKVVGSAESRFPDERAAMINGKFDEAANDLAETLTIPKIREPLQSWIQFHEGLALLLAGKAEEGRAVFAKMDDQGPFTKKGPDAETADFLARVAHQLRTKDVVPGDVSKDYDKWNFQGIALLAFAMKDWDMDQFDEATALFRQFGDVSPDKRVEWADGPEELKKLKEIGDNFVNDYKEFAPARKALDAADGKSMDDQKEAVDLATAARGRMKLSTKMSKSLDETLAVMGPKVAAAMAEKDKKTSDELMADEKALKTAKEKRADFISKFMFDEAHTAITDPNLKTEKARDEQELLSKKVQWLANFKSQLVEDLAKKGYAKPISKKSGDKLPGTVTKAESQGLIMTTPQGQVAIPWADVSLDSDYEMALSFIDPDMPPEIAGFRKWHLGVFAFFAGKNKEAQDLLHQAAELRSVFKDELPLFEKTGEPY